MVASARPWARFVCRGLRTLMKPFSGARYLRSFGFLGGLAGFFCSVDAVDFGSFLGRFLWKLKVSRNGKAIKYERCVCECGRILFFHWLRNRFLVGMNGWVGGFSSWKAFVFHCVFYQWSRDRIQLMANYGQISCSLTKKIFSKKPKASRFEFLCFYMAI